MASKIKNRISDDEFVNVCKNAPSMASAASTLKLHFNSFKKRAMELQCYVPNQRGLGVSKKKNKGKIPLIEIIFEGKHPHYQTYKLKQRLIEEGFKKNECEGERCRNKGMWNGKPLEMELEHVDGDRTNHLLSNLKMLCPNCHAQTPTYRGKNK